MFLQRGRLRLAFRYRQHQAQPRLRQRYPASSRGVWCREWERYHRPARSSHASAICALETPCFAATSPTTLTMPILASKFSFEKRGSLRRQSFSGRSSMLFTCPVRKPRPSGEYGTKPIPCCPAHRQYIAFDIALPQSNIRFVAR